ncbi:MAG: hypothetical protein KC455_10660 [Carnobacterium sp.]|nr:hypothetical protein [Carnobacterium sp.]
MGKLKGLNIHTIFFISIFSGISIFIVVLILTEIYPDSRLIRKISSPELLIASAVAFPTIITWYFSIKSNTEQNLLETVKHYDQEINGLIKDVQESNKLTTVHISKIDYIMNSFEKIIKDNYKKEAISLNYEGLLSVVYAAQPNINFSKIYEEEKIEKFPELPELPEKFPEKKEINKKLSEKDNEWIASSSKIVPRIIKKLCENNRMESLEYDYYKVFANSKFDIMQNAKIKVSKQDDSINLKNKEFWECEFSMNFIKNTIIKDCNFYSCVVNFEDIFYRKSKNKEEIDGEIKKMLKDLENSVEKCYPIENEEESYKKFKEDIDEIRRHLKSNSDEGSKQLIKMIKYLEENIEIVIKFFRSNNFMNSIQLKTNSTIISLSNSVIVRKILNNDGNDENLINDSKDSKKLTIIYDDRDKIEIKKYMYQGNTTDIPKINEISSKSRVAQKKFILDKLIEEKDVSEISSDNCVIKISKEWEREGFIWMGFHSITWKPYDDIEKIKFYIFVIEMKDTFKCIIFEKDKFKILMKEKKAMNESQIDFKFYFGEKIISH